MKPSPVASARPLAEVGPPAWRSSVNRLLGRAAEDWGWSKNAMVGVFLLPFFIAILGVALALIGKDAFKLLVSEDQIGENLQVVLWVVTFVLCLAVMRDVWRQGRNLIALLYLLLCVGIVFLVGEEISWGQRLFGWETAQWMKEINRQDENTLHNIDGVQIAFKWAHLLIGAYGLFLPLLLLRPRAPKSYREIGAFLVPHFILIPYFAFDFFWRLHANFWTPPRKYRFFLSEYAEVIELILAVGFLLFMIHQLRRRTPRVDSL